MGIVDQLKGAGFKAEKSEIGGRKIYEGVYKAALYDWTKTEDKGFGESVRARFKIQETMSGTDTFSQFPEFSGFFSLHPDRVANKRNGLAKLINGLFSVGLELDTTTDEKLFESLDGAKGTVLFIKGYKKQPMKREGDTWVENEDGEVQQGFTFMTEKNAEREAKRSGAPF